MGLSEAFQTPAGWHYNKKFNLYQRVNGRVYAYIQNFIGFYNLQFYTRGNMSFCDIEARSHDFDKLLQQAETWLEEYKDGDISRIHANPYSPSNDNGYWMQYRYNKEIVYI